MAEGTAPVQTIQERIKALNLGHVGRAPTLPLNDSAVPDRPSIEQRSNSASAASIAGFHPGPKNGIGNEPNGRGRNGVLPPPTITRTAQIITKPGTPTIPPKLPPRAPSSQSSPALPRRPTEPLHRRESAESVTSTISTISTISNLSNGTARTPVSRTPLTEVGRKLPPAFDSAPLPPTPPRRPVQVGGKQRIPLMESKSTSSVPKEEHPPQQDAPSLPPRRQVVNNDGPSYERKLAPVRPARIPGRSALLFGMNKASADEGAKEDTSLPAPEPIDNAPPPIPLSSRPDLSKLLATKPNPHAVSSASACLLCRDFSAPDAHAAKFPRQSVPSLDWLAVQLVAPFPSPTDRARVIFTWLHHNIDYDVVSFFNDAVRPATPATTLSTGLAVCEGYAGLFTAIAAKAGLESVVVGGHGKGFGFATLPPNAPLPAEYSTHAWNAVKIDNGEWKLIDCCWGAGNVSGKGQPYNRDFTPKFFTMSNEEFGLRHFPTNKSQFFRNDGRLVTWEEYIIGDRGGELVRVFSAAAAGEGIAETSILPKYLHIPVAPSQHPGPTVRFQFSTVCEHWDPVRHGAGKPYVFILAVHGPDGRGSDYIPFETNSTSTWWADVVPRQLGAPGQTITLFTVETVGGASGRGLGLDEYRLAKGRKAMSFQGVAAWELV